MQNVLIQKIISNKTLHLAFRYVCKSRLDYSCSSDIWELRKNWEAEREKIKEAIVDGTYRLAPVKKILRNNECLEIWSSRDAVVLKALSIVLTKYLDPQISKNCYNFKNHGGAKKAVRAIMYHKNNFKYLFKTDIKSYYASINHEAMMDIARRYIPDKSVLSLIYQFLKRTIYYEGYYLERSKGICRGSPLSPILGTLYLKAFDDIFGNKPNIFYGRFVDDVIIFAKNSFQMRRLIKKTYTIIGSLKLKLAEDKTFIGRIDKGFSFVGYRFYGDEISISNSSIENFGGQFKKRLYEPGCREKRLNPHTRISLYVRRWMSWAYGGLGQWKEQFTIRRKVNNGKPSRNRTEQQPTTA